MDDERAMTVSRRDLIKKSAIAGGVVWATPLVMASPAGAAGTGACPNCPDGRLFGIKNDSSSGVSVTTIGGGATCITVPAGGVRAGKCLYDAGLITITAGGGTTTYTLAPGIDFCSAASKGGASQPGGECAGSSVVVSPNTPSAGYTRVAVSQATQSHTEIIVCVTGTLPAQCI